MTLDEAIKEFTDWAKGNRKEQNFWAAERDENDETNPLSYADCEGLARDAETRAEYHEQLAEWLMDYKKLRKENAELKSILNTALKDIHGKDICEVMNACKLCAIKFQQLCDIFPWQHANEALKLIGDENDAK